MTDIPTYKILTKDPVENKNIINNILQLTEIFNLLGSNPRTNIDIIV